MSIVIVSILGSAIIALNSSSCSTRGKGLKCGQPYMMSSDTVSYVSKHRWQQNKEANGMTLLYISVNLMFLEFA